MFGFEMQVLPAADLFGQIGSVGAPSLEQRRRKLHDLQNTAGSAAGGIHAGASRVRARGGSFGMQLLHDGSAA